MNEVTKVLECEGCGRVIATLSEYVRGLPHDKISYCDPCKVSRAKKGEKAKYAIHPGWVTSLRDGDRHYIGIAALVRLYGLKHDEWVPWINNGRDRDPDLYIHLYPKMDGNYTLARESENDSMD